MGRIAGCIVVVAVAMLVMATPAAAFGTFGQVHTYKTGAPVFGIAVADLNRDGNPDILAGGDYGLNSPKNHISYLRGHGDGTFKKAVKIPDIGGPEGIVTGSFNNDKIPDFAVADYESNTIGVYLGNKGGGFHRAQSLDDAAGPWLLQSADLNGDGHIDLVAGNYNSSGFNAITVFLGKTKGTFGSGHDYAGTSALQLGMGLAKFSNDPNPDVVLADGSGVTTFLKGNADGSFNPPQQINDQSLDPDFANFGNGLATGIFDTPKRDVAVGVDAVSHNNYVHVDREVGQSGLIIVADPTPVPGGPNGIASADFNLDGVDDLAVGNSGGGFTLLRSKNDTGAFALSPNSTYTGSGGAAWVATGKLNADRAPDVIVGTANSIDVYLNKKN